MGLVRGGARDVVSIRAASRPAIGEGGPSLQYEPSGKSTGHARTPVPGKRRRERFPLGRS